MKRTYRECDACGKRSEWGDDHLPTDWATLTVALRPGIIDLCPGCTAPTLDAVEKRQKS